MTDCVRIPAFCYPCAQEEYWARARDRIQAKMRAVPRCGALALSCTGLPAITFADCRAACEARWGEPRVVWHGSPSRLAWELARHVVVELVGNDDRVTLHVERSDPHTGEIEDFDMWTVVGPRMIGDGAVTPLPDAVALASRWPRGTA